MSKQDRTDLSPALGGSQSEEFHTGQEPQLGTQIDIRGVARHFISRFGGDSDFVHSAFYHYIQSNQHLTHLIIDDIRENSPNYSSTIERMNAVSLLEALVWENEDDQMATVSLITQLGVDHISSRSDEMAINNRAVESLVRSLATSPYHSVRVRVIDAIVDFSTARKNWRESILYLSTMIHNTSSRGVLVASWDGIRTITQIFEDTPLPERKLDLSNPYDYFVDILHKMQDVSLAQEAVNLIDASLEKNNLSAYQREALRRNLAEIANIFSDYHEFSQYIDGVRNKYPQQGNVYEELSREMEEYSYLLDYFED